MEYRQEAMEDGACRGRWAERARPSASCSRSPAPGSRAAPVESLTFYNRSYTLSLRVFIHSNV